MTKRKNKRRACSSASTFPLKGEAFRGLHSETGLYVAMRCDAPIYSLETMIEQVCLRPHGFTGEARFELVVNFVNGFFFGRGPAAHETINGFQAWLPVWLAETGYSKSDIPHNHGWNWYIQAVYPDDADAIKNLPLLFKEYLRQAKEKEAVDSPD